MVKKIALFGTSADPPTAGHQKILGWLAEHYDTVIVWASDNPFKEHQASLENRSQMLQLAIEEIDSAQDKINLFPELSDRRSLITIQKARDIWQNAEFTFVIGADLLVQISSWYHIKELLAQVKILIVPRPGYRIEQSDLENLKNLGGNFKIAALDSLKASSSAYRVQGDSTVLTPAVALYIKQRNLYQHNSEFLFQELEADIC
ncbi:nicotinate/nicotinamide nucleotide adenylyltransferase [Xenococcus sp. PCC 7305]|uniref:nicotinate-nucleotide adenylyltransferase n=1 Tax=Xenococcus sp. PCC 7305 TaxID=102125 RepID=UPI0002ACEEDD|nr:nicotinate-nucleotide adenylyltransferase [Xenococcus sp. PCC 7305]ELS02018.1 nicotinate/nicotinamide nucleotide adenylyltransferase [Xenococcus sp. PCC 7305]